MSGLGVVIKTVCSQLFVGIICLVHNDSGAAACVPRGRGEKSTNFVGAGYPLDGFRHMISDAQYEIESPSKQEKTCIHEMRARYLSNASGAGARL